MDAERVVIILLDGVGVGALPDAEKYGDEGSNTLVNTAKAVGGLKLPNLEKLGLGNIEKIKGVTPLSSPGASYGKMAQKSAGKDTITGHWEIAGIILDKPFPTYPNGFPKEIIEKFEKLIGRKVLGNVAASGTRIIEEYGREHLRTGFPIVYTSADSVFQIAAHEDVIPLNELYDICLTARKLLVGKHAVGRVIARPFVGKPGNFIRTSNRKDFTLEPPKENLLDCIFKAGMDVIGIGKIGDIFAGRSLKKIVKTKDNIEGIERTKDFLIDGCKRGLIFTNLVDFDTRYGHRNDPRGFADALEEFDKRLPEIIFYLKDKDVLIITSDHGCDPTTPSTDHSREYALLLVYGKNIKAVNLGIRNTFADLGASVADMLGTSLPPYGESFADVLMHHNDGK
ncbi:MAG TPA: phosphopentomutase [Peptococcaceae bacterium]|nr:MAG: Phosphopentomutase [Clostridia bacterium 41_269]HBT20470.1 phosphopentomutase [Peptococcaceae bacterium]